MSLATLRSRFDSLLTAINGTSSSNFSTRVENAYEALVLARVMTEYHAVYGTIRSFSFPIHAGFLNQSPGRFFVERSFKIVFASGQTFYFSADVEIFGLKAYNIGSPVGIKFEADVVVIPETAVTDITNIFNGYPAPQHLDSIYECKFGSFNKGQLRELLGLKRHITFLQRPRHLKPRLFSQQIHNSNPPIAVKMARPTVRRFLDGATADFYDLEQIIVN